jgi:hypothetical protein
MSDWGVMIGRMIKVKHAQAQIDVVGLYQYHLPRPAATEHSVQAVEGSLGLTLPESYRRFLLSASGWPSWDQDIDLFGPEELLGSGLFARATELLGEIEEPVIDNARLRREALLPIACASKGIDVFAVVTEPELRGHVVWFAGGIVERFSDFQECFLSVLRMAEEGLDKLREEVHDLLARGVPRQ